MTLEEFWWLIDADVEMNVPGGSLTDAELTELQGLIDNGNSRKNRC